MRGIGTPKAGKGIDARRLGIVKGAGGSRQVTYNRHSLYYYSNDSDPGDAMGQACYGSWYTLSPAGTPVREAGIHC